MSDGGAKPSKNGTNPAGEGAPGPEVTLLVNDRLDALERLLGTVRRRGMSFRIHSLARKDDHLVLVFRAAPNAVIPDRWIAELGSLVDVRKVLVAGMPAAAR
jgi:acetolactate synthase regulatory subunit